MLNHYKKCHHSEGDAAARNFCAWLVENTSTEFMEANINNALSCLQGQRISGYIGNTGIESWSGKTHFFIPELTADVEVGIEYSLDYSIDDFENFIQFTITAD